MTTSPTFPTTDRLLALEDARDWMQRALDLLAAGNVPGAVYAVHAALEHGREAEDTLIDLFASAQAYGPLP